MNELRYYSGDDQTEQAEKSNRPRPATFGLLVRCSNHLSYEVKLGEVAERWYYII